MPTPPNRATETHSKFEAFGLLHGVMNTASTKFTAASPMYPILQHFKVDLIVAPLVDGAWVKDAETISELHHDTDGLDDSSAEICI